MAVSHKIAESLFRSHPTVIERGGPRALQRGDLVVDKGYAEMPRVLDEGTGRIAAIVGRYAQVEWHNGDIESVPLDSLKRITTKYEPMIHESAYEIPKWSKGTKVVLGNGDHGHVIEEVTGPTGFKSYRVQIDASKDRTAIGRRVFATNNAMYKVSGLMPDAVVTVFGGLNNNAVATIGCELAVDTEDQVIGLQKYSSLPSENGMLFPYDPPRDVSFHMGNVRFPIDVLFIDSTGRIASIFEDRQPGYDEQWRGLDVSAVLEVNGGWCEEHDVNIGDVIAINMTRTAQADPFQPEISGLSDPGVDNPAKNPRLPTDPKPMDPERFKGRDTPDQVLDGDTQYLDPAHWDSQMGYDPGKFREEDGPAFRPAAQKTLREMAQEQVDADRKRLERAYPAKPGGCKNCGGNIKPAFIDTDLCKLCLLDHKLKELAANGQVDDNAAYLAMQWAQDQFV